MGMVVKAIIVMEQNYAGNIRAAMGCSPRKAHRRPAQGTG